MTSAGSVQNSTKNAEQKPSNSRYAGVQAEIRKKMLEKCQSEHLSGSLFPLNDVLISPRLLARIHPPSPDDALQYFPVLYQSLPNLFDNPELLTGLPYPTITLEKALQWGSRIAVCGYAGSGKTTLLLDLTSRICNATTSPGGLRDSLPVYVHCRDLSIGAANRENALFPLANFLAGMTNRYEEKVIRSSLLAAAEDNHLILFLDGLEEISPSGQSKVTQWLHQLLKEHPSLKMVLTSIPHFSSSLSVLGFENFSISPWAEEDKKVFIDKFAAAWSSCFKQTEESSLIPIWLKTAKLPGTPLEMTLACWSAFSGNPISLLGTEIFTPYLHNVIRYPIDLATLSTVASAMINSGDSGISLSALEGLISKDPMFKGTDLEKNPPTAPAQSGTQILPSGPTPRSIVNELLETGILCQSQGRYLIKNTHLWAALYSLDPSLRLPNSWQNAIQSTLADSIMLFACATGKADALISQWLSEMDYPLFRNIQIISHWLTAYPQLTRELLIRIYKKVILLTQKSSLPVSLQIKILEPLLISGEQAALSFFKEMVASTDLSHRQAGTFCLSFFPSEETDQLLIGLTSDPDLDVQKLACIGLAKSWSLKAQKQLVYLVTSGAPEIRQIIGELFAFIPGDGHELLKELTVLPDNPEARKAAVDGLLLVNSDWSKALIKKVNIEDTEWLVRDTAANAVKLGSTDHLFRASKKAAPSNIPWLIKFAASKRMGIYANDFPTDLLILAAKEGEPHMQSAAFETLASDPSAESIHFLKQAFLHARGPVQEYAYAALQTLSNRGVDLQK